MSGFAEALIYIVQTLGSLYLLIVLLRFILQLVRADFYNPLSQFTVKATQPLLKPLRRIIPGFGGLDLASLALAILVQLVLMVLVILIAGANPAAVGLQLLVWAIIAVTSLFLKIFFFAMIISVILSWVAPGSTSPGAARKSAIRSILRRFSGICSSNRQRSPPWKFSCRSFGWPWFSGSGRPSA